MIDNAEKKIRLQVYLAHSGIASRRECEKIISAGRVKVNGEIINAPGVKVSESDTISVDDKIAALEKEMHYIAMNKPPGYLCSQKDGRGRLLARSLIAPNINERVYNIGRLDFLSSGLLFWTNDGGFAAALSHPSSMIEKEYVVEASAPVPKIVLDSFSNGIEIENVFYKCEEIEKTSKKTLRVVLIEGKNREIRRVFSHFRLHPKKLQRVRIGKISLGNLEEGGTRNLAPFEIEALR